MINPCQVWHLGQGLYLSISHVSLVFSTSSFSIPLAAIHNFLIISFIVFLKARKKKEKKKTFGRLRLWFALVYRPSLCLSVGGGLHVDVVRFSTGLSVYRKVIFCFTSSSLWPLWNLRAGRPDCPAFLLASGFLLQKDLRNIRQIASNK